MDVWDFHDRFILWLIQEVVYAHQTLAVAVWFAALLALPAHRRLALVIRWCFLLAGLVCVACYNALQEAPFLGYFLLAAMGYLVLRWLLWRLPQRIAARPLPRLLTWLRPRLVWSGPIVRDYFRADPCGVYWLDLARAVRGVPLVRTAEHRRETVAAVSYLPGWRKTGWRILFWLVEARIQLYRRLPAYWHRPRSAAGPRNASGRLDLDEPFARSILEEEQRIAYRKMLEWWTGSDFADYCRRDAVARQESARQAALWGCKDVLHREALAEYWTFRTPWEPKQRSLVQAAWRIYGTWRHRRQYDFLWHPESAPAADPSRPPDANGTSAGTGDNAEPTSFRPEPTSSGTGQPPAESTAALPSSIESSRESMPERATPDAPRLAFAEDAPPAAPFPAAGPQSPRADARSTEEDSPVAPEAETDADDELFQPATPEVDPVGKSPVRGPLAGHLIEFTDRDRARLEDLQLASRLLEAYLGVTPSGDFARDLERVEPFLDQPKHVTAAAMLLLLYCLRRDYGGRETDRQKVDLILRLGDRFREAPAEGPYRETRSVLRTLQYDWLAERGDYSQLVAGLTAENHLTRYEWKLLADAEAALAQQLSGQPELRDVLRQDAIDHYFQAGFRGLWTLPYAKAVLGQVASMEELVELLRANSVEVAPSTSLSVAAAARPRRTTRPTAKPSKPSVRR